MVSARTRYALAVAVALCLLSPLPAKELTDYRIGSAVATDLEYFSMLARQTSR